MDFAFLLLMVSVLTSLAVQALKSILDEQGWSYAPNTLAGAVAVVLGIAVGIITGCSLAAVIALVFLSWLCAMLGYDKVKQALEQITAAKED